VAVVALLLWYWLCFQRNLCGGAAAGAGAALYGAGEVHSGGHTSQSGLLDAAILTL
jgi:hypothetical protein